MRKVLLLGASGNIGTQTLDILSSDPASFELVAISVGNRIQKIPTILKRFPSVSYVCVKNEEDYLKLKKEYPSLKWFFGDQGLLDIISSCDCSLVVNALVGFSGLYPSIKVLEENKILCLANKESLVIAGDYINSLLRKGLGRLYPIDSEHVAIAKCLSKVPLEKVKKLILTGSGGAFRNLPISALKDVTPEMALKHPTWVMGERITIDCATMMNKGFEVIEAHHLFNFDYSNIDIILHDESYVHSLIQLDDGSYYADVGKPDMHGPIAYALYEGKAPFEISKVNSLEEFKGYHFHPFSLERYPAVPLAIKAGKGKIGRTAILNAADEEAVKLFLKGRINFLDIVPICEEALNFIKDDVKEVSDFGKLDRIAREFVIERYK